MNPLTYVRSHWHAMAVGAIVWHFAGPWVTSQLGGVVGGASKS